MPIFKKRPNTEEGYRFRPKVFLKVYEDGLKLKQNHAYYYQCQGVINILEVPWIDFIVHTEKDIHVERIYRDKILWENHMITGLTDFYIKYILPKLNT